MQHLVLDIRIYQIVWAAFLQKPYIPCQPLVEIVQLNTKSSQKVSDGLTVISCSVCMYISGNDDYQWLPIYINVGFKQENLRNDNSYSYCQKWIINNWYNIRDIYNNSFHANYWGYGYIRTSLNCSNMISEDYNAHSAWRTEALVCS